MATIRWIGDREAVLVAGKMPLIREWTTFNSFANPAPFAMVGSLEFRPLTHLGQVAAHLCAELG